MKYQLLFICSFIIALYPLYAQITSTDSIEIKDFCLGQKSYSMKNKTLSFKRLVNILETMPECETAVEKAKLNNTMSYIFSFAGGFIIGYYYSVNKNWENADDNVNFRIPLFFGGSLMFIAIPIGFESEKHILDAVKIYNSKINKL